MTRVCAAMNNSLSQYLELFAQQRAAIEAASAPHCNALREAALAALTDAVLPRRGQEDYEATDLNAMFAPDYGVNINRVNLAHGFTPSFKCDVPNLSASPIYMVGDTIVTPALDQPAGVVVAPLSATHIPHDIVRRYYGTVAAVDDPAVALNTLLAQDALLVYVPRGVKARPLQLINTFNASRPTMAVRRILLVAEEDAQVQMLVCDHNRSGKVNHLSNQVVEIVAGAGATVDYYDMEESEASASRVMSLHVKQERGSNVLFNGITLSCGTTRNNIRFSVSDHAEAHLMGMAIAGGTQHIDNHTFIDHHAPAATSREMFKYVLSGEAVGAFAGKILVRHDCPKVDAYQGNRNLVTSPAARMYTKPQLEIYTDDVKCAHGSTIGQLDEEALFYMRSRGITLDEARRLLMQAFMADVIDTVRLASLRERLHHLVERRFTGVDVMCSNCPINQATD